jgi:hypothetical protein
MRRLELVLDQWNITATWHHEVEFFAFLGENDVHAAVIEIGLADVDGIDLCQHVLAQRPDLRVMLVAHARKLDRKRVSTRSVLSHQCHSYRYSAAARTGQRRAAPALRRALRIPYRKTGDGPVHRGGREAARLFLAGQYPRAAKLHRTRGLAHPPPRHAAALRPPI